jgi:ankyrin repeat protein
MNIDLGSYTDVLKGAYQRLDRAYDQQEQQYREQKARALTDQQQRCHQAFKISNYTEQKDINPRRAEGTCQWALRSPEYLRWWESLCNDLLWVSADPGCGKSVLAKSIIDDYLQPSSSAVTVCYFFFKDNDEQNNLATALCAILHQLFSHRPHLLYHALPSWERNWKGLRQEVNELWRIFITATSAEPQGTTVCILDALDECRDADQNWLIQKLKEFNCQSYLSMQGTWLKFLVTSRPYEDIQHRFQEITDSFPHLHLKGEEENDQIHKEIDLVVKIRVRELAKAARLSSNIQQRLEQQLLRMEHRTYLWLHLAMDDIQNTFKNSLWPADESIPLIPASVNAAYAKILDRVPSAQVPTVRKILQIIVAARRPLTIREMAMALGIARQPQLKAPTQATVDPAYLDKKLRRLCGLFVFANNSKIYLIHQTARDFIVTIGNALPQNLAFSCTLTDTEDQMAHICLRYLSMDGLENNESSPCSDIQSFLEYSAVYWPDHVRNMSSTEDREVKNLLHQVYDTTAPRFSLWFPIFWKATMRWVTMPIINPMHLAALNGHQDEVLYLLGEGESILNVADTTGSYPLMWASLNGHYDVVQTMLSHGADVNAHGGDYGHALVAACSEGHCKIAQILLEQGADINAQGGYYGNALQAACSKGHHEIVSLLLDCGADVNAERGLWGNALYDACSRGHERTVQVLLEGGAEVNIQGGHYGNALQAACSEGHDRIMQVLLERGADVNAQGGHYGNALQAAFSKGHDKIMRVLLDRGADFDANGGHTVTDNNRWMPVDIAPSNGYLKMATLIDPRSRGEELVPSPNDVYVQRERNEKNEDIFQWSVFVSRANWDAGRDSPSPPRLRPHHASRKFRTRSTGVHRLTQEGYFNLKSRDGDASFPGPGVLVHESSDDLSEDEASISAYSDEPSADVDETGRYDCSTPEVYSSFSPTTEEQSSRLYPWHDPPRDTTPRSQAMQPGSSNDAMIAFNRRAQDLERASLAATIDNNSIINVGASLANFSFTEHPKKRTSLFKHRFLQASSKLKRQASDLSIGQSNSYLGLPQPDTQDSPAKRSYTPRNRILHRRHLRLPTLSSGLLAMTSQMAAVGGSQPVRAVSSTPSPNPESSPLVIQFED